MHARIRIPLRRGVEVVDVDIQSPREPRPRSPNIHLRRQLRLVRINVQSQVPIVQNRPRLRGDGDIRPANSRQQHVVRGRQRDISRPRINAHPIGNGHAPPADHVTVRGQNNVPPTRGDVAIDMHIVAGGDRDISTGGGCRVDPQPEVVRQVDIASRSHSRHQTPARVVDAINFDRA